MSMYEFIAVEKGKDPEFGHWFAGGIEDDAEVGELVDLCELSDGDEIDVFQVELVGRYKVQVRYTLREIGGAR